MKRVSALAAVAFAAVLVGAACTSGTAANPDETAPPAASSSPSATPTPLPTSTETSTVGILAQANDGGEAAGTAIARAYLSASDTPILTVNGANVSARDFAVDLQILKNDVVLMEQHIAPTDPSAATVLPRFRLIQSSGLENVALADLIERQAVYQKVVGLGMAPSAADIANYVDHTRSVLGEPTMASEKAIADTLGDVYWNVYLPDEARNALAQSALEHAKMPAGAGPTDAARLWIQTETDAANSAVVKILDSSALDGATLEGAKTYLTQFNQLDIELATARAGQ